MGYATRWPVVVGVDGSESALRAVRWAAAQAARRGYRCAWSTSTTLRSAFRGRQSISTSSARRCGHSAGAGCATRAPSRRKPCPIFDRRPCWRPPRSCRCYSTSRARPRSSCSAPADSAGSPGSWSVVRDHPARALLRYADGAQLVVGTRGRGGLRGLVLGSTGQHLQHHAPCPVAVVRTGTNT